MRKGKQKSGASERGTLSERICRALDIKPDAAFGGSLIEIRGRGSITVRGGGRILKYTENEIRLELRKSVLSVCGKRLVCITYYAGAVGIEGRIDSVCFIAPDASGVREK